ncbi:MAG: hypothetical protein QF664_00535 [Dehalococcoidia bacterium]|nr:hypothetical protein [Dehalococcoidia bacterium]
MSCSVGGDGGGRDGGGGDGGGGGAPATAPAGSATPVPVAAAPTVDDLREIAVRELGEGATVDELHVPAGEERLWLVASAPPDAAGIAGDTAGDGVVSLYRKAEGGWVELRRLRLDRWRGAMPVEITPDRVWIQTGDSSEPGRGLRLLTFDGLDLIVRFAVPPDLSVESVPLRAVVDHDGDGLLDIVVDTSTTLLCDGCFIEPSVDIHRWDGARLTVAQLERLPDFGPPALRTPVDRAIELARAGLWLDAAFEISGVRLIIGADDSLRVFLPAVAWNSVLIDFHVAAYRDGAGRDEPGVPALASLVAGDYDALLELVRESDPETLFAGGGPLLAGTPGEGMAAELGRIFVERAAAAVAVRDDLAAAYFVRGLGRFLIDPADVVTARADVRQAEGLRPYDEFLREASKFLHAIDAAAPGR